jgi:acyl-CoA-dependent ceramide synthase
MDIADVFLSTAKMLKYCGFTLACDTTFAVFVVVWCYSRLYVFSIFLWSCIYEAPGLVVFKWEPESDYYLTRNVLNAFIGLFFSLLSIILYWSWLILRVLLKVLSGGKADDADRSDDEDASQTPERYWKLVFFWPCLILYVAKRNNKLSVILLPT